MINLNKTKKNTSLRMIPTMTFIHFLTGKSSGILSGIFSGIFSGILSGKSSGILSGISSGIFYPRWVFNLGCSTRFSPQTPNLKTWRAKLCFALRPFEFATTVPAGHGQATSIRCGKNCSSLLTQKLYKEIAL